jgi:hypothetical protein
MDLIRTVSNVLGVICVIIGILLIPLAVWFLLNAIKNKKTSSYVIAGLLFLFAAGCGVGAYSLFTQGILKLAPM